MLFYGLTLVELCRNILRRNNSSEAIPELSIRFVKENNGSGSAKYFGKEEKMNKRLLLLFLSLLVIVPLVFIGCRNKTVEAPDMQEAVGPNENYDAMMEPAQTVATETIPPTAALPSAPAPAPIQQMKQDRNREMQKALKAAGYYTGPIDGKIGPKTRAAIEAFQTAKGLKVDGKVGPRTWAELEKYLVSREAQE